MNQTLNNNNLFQIEGNWIWKYTITLHKCYSATIKFSLRNTPLLIELFHISDTIRTVVVLYIKNYLETKEKYC